MLNSATNNKMKDFFLMILTIGFFSCNQDSVNTEVLQSRVESLESKLADAYKPGFGEFMSAIQAHHAKLWFAGQNKNWKLADFEVHEIMENFDAIKKISSRTKGKRSDWNDKPRIRQRQQCYSAKKFCIIQE
ncbi:MAG: hypothetical protein ORN85_07915 [Sediminibacterium sp.]|nr:hypothetical protein [Sediminibacterium sp.]